MECETECCRKECRNGEKSDLSFTPFRQVEKKYKLMQYSKREAKRRETPSTDFSEVVDFLNLENNSPTNRALIHGVTGGGVAEGLKCFTFGGVPGLLIFPGALTAEEQCHLCREAILSYGDSSLHPNIISTHAKKPEETQCYQPPMRWSTLGFSYEWTTKTYDRVKYSKFPPLVRDKMKYLMQLVNTVHQDSFVLFPSGDHPTTVPPPHYEPQTAIVNYYPVGSMMMCHQDISEETLDRPLVSVSLGCSCVFLMGTNSREDVPFAFVLRSGDVVAFSGPSRTAFHSVPRILDDCPDYLTIPEEELTEEEAAAYDNHVYYRHKSPDGSFVPVQKEEMSEAEKERYWRLCMRHMRVNINARQVYEEECPFIF